MEKNNVFQPDVEILFRQEPMSREQLKELLGMDLSGISTGAELQPDQPKDVKRSPRAKFVYDKELDALVQEDLRSNVLDTD